MTPLRRLIAAILMLAMQGCATVGGTAPGSVADGLRAQGVVELPIEIRQGHVLVAGRVNGRPGRFMLDSGTPFRFFLNRGVVPLAVGPEVGRGRAGSGQAIVVHEALDLASLQLAGHAELAAAHGAPVSGVRAADFSFLQPLIPDFLGFVGAPWLAGQVFSLRFAPAQMLLADAGQADRLLQGSARVTLVRFEGQDGPLPYATFQLGPINLRALFDTGNPGTLQLTADTHARLVKVGALRCMAGSPVTCLPQGLRHGPQVLDAAPLPLTIGADNRIVLGTALLQRYVSVWNLRDGTVDLRRALSP